MGEQVMSDLFLKISRGSILLWNVTDESELPKRKELIRLLGTDEFTYYKTHGHHKNHIRSLARLKDCLSPDNEEKRNNYWPRTETSHFLFTEKVIEPNSFFLLKYSGKCLGSYFVSSDDLNGLSELLRHFDQVCRFTDEINDWPRRIESHKDEIKKYGIEDQAIEQFEISRLVEITRGYGQQSMDHAASNIKAWHTKHFWTISAPKPLETEEQVTAIV